MAINDTKNLPATDLIQSERFSARVNSLLEEHHLPGVAIAVAEGDTTASAAWGYACLNPPRPFTPDTVIDIASVSKSLTAAVIASFVEDNEKYPEIQWTSVMSELLPGDFVMSEESYTEAITLEDILSHRTGLCSHDISYRGSKAEQPDDARSVTRNLRNLPMAAPIRTKYMYCNMMFTVAAYLVSVKSGMSFVDYVQKHVFGPLNMTSSTIQPSRAIAKGLGDRMATGYAWRDSEYQDFQLIDCVEGEGAGSIVTSVNDWIKYVKAFMDQQAPFSEAIYKSVVRQRMLTDPDNEDSLPFTSSLLYAAGWDVCWYRGHQIFMHDGGVPGVGTHNFFLPGLKFGGAIFGNSDSDISFTSMIARELIDEVLVIPVNDRPDWNKLFKDLAATSSDEEKAAKKREALCPGHTEPQPLEMPLSAYTGTYHNAGYHHITIDSKDGGLFIDWYDRSIPLTYKFEHVCDQTKFIAYETESMSGAIYPIGALFELRDGKTTRWGLELEKDLKSQDGYIWFDRI